MVQTKMIIEFLLGLVFLVIIVALMYSSMGGKIFPWMRERLINQEKNIDATVNNFDVMLRNLEDCKIATKEGCLCDGFPSWPSFLKDTSLEMETRGSTTTFILKHDKKELRTEKLQDLKISAKLIKKGTTPNTYVLEDLASDPRMIMDWRTSPPIFKLGGDPGTNWFQNNIGMFRPDERKAVSGFIYHEQGKMYFLTSFEPEDKIAGFIGSMMKCAS